MNDAIHIERIRRLGIVALALALSLTLGMPATTLARQPSPNEWIGKAVVAKARTVTLKDPRDGSAVKVSCEIYRVSRVDRSSLLLSTATGDAGWASSDQVVSLDQAGAFFTSQVRANPGESFNHAMRAIVSLVNEPEVDADRALADLNEAIRLAPRDAEYFLARAEVWRARGELGKSVADCDAALRIDPRSVGALILRASIWADTKEYDKAIAGYNEVIRRDPQVIPAYFGRAAVEGQRGDIDKAITDLTEVIRLEPTMALGFCNRAFAWKSMKQFDKAIADYTEAVRLEPRDSDAYCGRGWSWREKQQFAKALADFSEALKIDPRDACALDGRAWIMATCPDANYRDGKKAVEVAIEACELTRWKAAYCLETLAAAHAEAGDFTSAVKWQVKAIELEADPKEKEEYRARLKLFQEKQPFREIKP